MQKQSKQTPRTKKKGKKSRAKRQKMVPWLSTLLDPFTYGSVHIPDEKTSASGLVTSKFNLRTAPRSIASDSSGVTHSMCFVIPPYLGAGIFKCDEQTVGSGILSDLASPTTYNQRERWVNQSAIVPDIAKHRLVALGVRVIYEGTDLNRSARIVAGCVPSTEEAFGVESESTVTASVLSPLYNTAFPNLTNVVNGMQNTSEARAGEVFSCHWVPNGVPFYQQIASADSSNLTTLTSGNQRTPNTLFNSGVGMAGVEAGQNNLVILIENDTTSAASRFGNTYSLEFIAHWEVVPGNPVSVGYQLTPSDMDLQALQAALNMIGRLPSGSNTSVANYTFGTPGASTESFNFSSFRDYLPSLNTVRTAAELARYVLLPSQTVRQRQIGY